MSVPRCDTTFCSFVYFFIIKDFVLTHVFHRFFVVCFYVKPHVIPHVCRVSLDRTNQAGGSSLTEAGFASIDAAFPGGVWVLRIHQDDITCVKETWKSLRNLSK